MNLMKSKIISSLTLLAMMMIGSIQFGYGQIEEDHDPDSPMGEWIVPTSEDAPLTMLTPPDSFEPSTAFNGYLSLKTSSAIIMILLNDVTYVSLAEGVTDEYLAANNLELVSRTDITSIHGFNGVNFKMKFTVDNTEFVRYMTFIGDVNKTLWLNTTYPKMVEGLVEAKILESILSVNIYPN